MNVASASYHCISVSSFSSVQYLSQLELPCPSLEAAEVMMTRSEALDILGIITLITLSLVTILTAVIIIRLRDKLKILFNLY